jgi:26S proteasome regulatory subunit N11
MPQSGTGVSVEAVDPVFQAKMLDMLRQTGRPEMVVGWYHSHPGFGCWLSGVDINTQQSFEALSERAGNNHKEKICPKIIDKTLEYF